jgi:hypothetical protein
VRVSTVVVVVLVAVGTRSGDTFNFVAEVVCVLTSETKLSSW